MRQLLLRVPDELHARLVQRAATEGRSVNALATEVLNAVTAGEQLDERARVRAKAAALGLLVTPPYTPPMTPEERDRIIGETRGWGPVLDEIINEERDRR